MEKKTLAFFSPCDTHVELCQPAEMHGKIPDVLFSCTLTAIKPTLAIKRSQIDFESS